MSADHATELPKPVIDPDCVEIEEMRDPDDIGRDPLLDDAEVYRHSRTS
ncbi:hypothetical protein NVV93_16290 [Pseudomonas sp. LS44]|nr:hypothetical protein [Pseudomonas sp. LS44]UVE17127.1 hypothetical protein NVV93_16290 [Pseudomonas sp. LS44]